MSIFLPLSILIWDTDSRILKPDDIVALWLEFIGASKFAISILNLVEKSAYSALRLLT